MIFVRRSHSSEAVCGGPPGTRTLNLWIAGERVGSGVVEVIRPVTLEWLAWRLLTLGCEFEVHEPPELVAYLREISGRAGRAAGPTTTGAGRPPPPAGGPDGA
ncbi:WYL domain-containing protein [Micromonospora sp. NPDC023633]|uniref:WYL domain-containing protein n=1 Tax=Micromonospora sp. NPDC023633 TaxID=3154320 RepID=UPI00340531F3